jgi:hypothetical protein
MQEAHARLAELSEKERLSLREVNYILGARYSSTAVRLAATEEMKQYRTTEGTRVFLTFGGMEAYLSRREIGRDGKWKLKK